MGTLGNLMWSSIQDFRTLKRVFEFPEPFFRVRWQGFSIKDTLEPLTTLEEKQDWVNA